MPKKAKRKSKASQKKQRTIFLVIVVVVGIGLGIVALHDGVFGRTPIKTITDTPSEYLNLNVIIKGNITGQLTWLTLDVISIKDSSGATILVDISSYPGALPPIGSNVVIQGEVEDFLVIPYIIPTSISQVWSGSKDIPIRRPTRRQSTGSWD